LAIRKRISESEEPINVRRKMGYLYSGDVNWLVLQEPVERGKYLRLWLILQQSRSVCKPAMECSRTHGIISAITGLPVVIRNSMTESDEPINVRRKTGYLYSGDVTWLVLYPPTSTNL
jgi:hypothetical protein